MTDTKAAFRPWRWLNGLIAVVGLLLASVICAPQLLAFPYHADVGATLVYSDTPLDLSALRPVLARADTRLRTSPLYRAPVGTRAFLTDGGWRWRLLALTSRNTLGFTRPGSDLVSDAVILNSSDIARDSISTAFGSRSLSGVIAHERTHIMVRRHLGMLAGLQLPAWISEGYADHVAGESTLSAAEFRQLRAAGNDHPAVFYYEARRRVEAALAANGNNIEALLEQP